MGSFRFPTAEAEKSLTEDAAVARLRGFASAHRDPAVAENLGGAFAAQAVAAYRHPLRKHVTLDPLISEYSIGSPEGVALMQLAEALIRLPPEATGMPAQLVRDKLATGDLDFFSHARSDKSFLVNASSLALSTAKRILRGAGAHAGGDAAEASAATGTTLNLSLSAAVSASGMLEGSIKRGLGILGRKFTLGPDIETAVRRAASAERRQQQRALSHSFDMLGEGARTQEDARRYLQTYVDAVEYIAREGAGPDARHRLHQPQMSVKLSSLCPRFDELSRATALPQLSAALGELVAAADGGNSVSLFVDAEEQRRLELSLSVIEATVRAHRPASIGVAVQAYGRRALPTLHFLEEVARANPQTEIRVRLVKGAYWDGEIKEAQVEGADVYPVWTSKRHTDVAYLACAATLLNSRWLKKPAFATHNTRTVADVLAMTTMEDFVANGCEFQRLHGMGESFDYSGAPLRVYAPTGTTSDLLAYLVRRMLENGANSSFLKQLADGREHLLNVDVLLHPASSAGASSDQSAVALSSPGDLLAEGGAAPAGGEVKLWAATTAASTAAGMPVTSSLLIPSCPRAIYADRLGARGVDYEHPDFPARFAWTPAFAPAAGAGGGLDLLSFEDAGAALDRLKKTQLTTTTVGQRAGVLRAAADIIEAETLPLTKLIMQEAGKTLVDAINEVRECVDFFRFYAKQAEQTLVERRLTSVTGEECVIAPQPRGPWLCVGPFNFPFAIVGGLTSSAFVAGNPVVVKPHPATPLCAAAIVDVLRRAGMKEGAVTVVPDSCATNTTAAAPATGSDAGATLVASGAFAGVSFVGSTATAAKINHQLALNSLERGLPLAKLVAETGGLNVLIADSSALPEQVCDAVLASFAAAAGQRCSSARVLVLDAGCKTAVMRLIAGGLQALRVREDVMDLSTDVGPLISAHAVKVAEEHCARLEAQGATLLCTSERQPPADAREDLTLPAADDDAAAAAAASDRVFHPRVYELPGGADARRDMLQGEVFAPILHVIEYNNGKGGGGGSPTRPTAGMSSSDKELATIIDAVNAKGFALTGGVLTRCDSVKALVKSRLNCGNLYVNRDTVGAVVESQPFGGHGLSGNGVKAGGEGYLEQFVCHKVVSEDTTASGGDLELLRSEA